MALVTILGDTCGKFTEFSIFKTSIRLSGPQIFRGWWNLRVGRRFFEVAVKFEEPFFE